MREIAQVDSLKYLYLFEYVSFHKIMKIKQWTKHL